MLHADDGRVNTDAASGVSGPQARVLHVHDQKTYALLSVYYGILIVLLPYNLVTRVR